MSDKLQAALTSALLSTLFVVVYGACNWITAHRANVGMLYFEWERRIPFVPLMIVPYMSIDLFFVAAPFLCGGVAELRTYARRIAFAIVAAGICFLVMPFRFAFARPQAAGALGAIFDTFRQFDQPYNLFPSLHITLRTILADLYARHTKGAVRATSHLWFSLVGLSTLLTYQHHVMDVLGGFALAGFCFYIFRESTAKPPVARNTRVGWYYSLASLSAFVLVLLLWPWGAILLWPMAALGIVAAAYFRLGSGIFRKADGRLPLSTRLVLGPVLLGQHLSLRYYRRRCRAWDRVVSGVVVGCKLGRREAEEAKRQGVTAVLDLTSEFSETAPFLAITYLNVPVLDLTAPTVEQLRQAADFITANAATGTVYVHCKIGYSRSAAAVGAYLLTSGYVRSVEQAVDVIRQARPSVIVRPEALEAMRAFHKSCVPLVTSTFT